jgi:hypothetical protein
MRVLASSYFDGEPTFDRNSISLVILGLDEINFDNGLFLFLNLSEFVPF